MANLDNILKSRDITWPTKVCLVEAMVFPVVMYGCESWTVKKAECRRIDTFEPQTIKIQTHNSTKTTVVKVINDFLIHKSHDFFTVIIELESAEFAILVFPTLKSNQSILKEISPGYTLEGMMLKLKPQYFGRLI